jgi:peptidoglycan/LPS O-acetylase OafA/YrhL
MVGDDKRLFGMDVLRGGAVLAIVFHHSFRYLNPPDWLQFLGPLGSLGAEALLVLSGYLIGHGLIRKMQKDAFGQAGHLGDFYARRWLRTLPPYYFYLLVSAAIFPPLLDQLLSHASYFVFLQNFAWKMPESFYPQSWTLAVLEFFYLLFPLALFLTRKWVRHPLLCFLPPVALFLLVPLATRGCFLAMNGPVGVDDTIRKWVVFRLDTPIVGVVLALIEAGMPSMWTWMLRRSWLGLAALAGCAAYYLASCPGLNASTVGQLLFFNLTAACIAVVFPLLSRWNMGPGVVRSSVRTVADLSYTIYVSQYLVLAVSFVLMAMLGVSQNEWVAGYALLVIVMAAIVYPSYRLIEEPFLRLRNARAPQKSLVLAMGARVAAFTRMLVPGLRAERPVPAQL